MREASPGQASLIKFLFYFHVDNLTMVLIYFFNFGSVIPNIFNFEAEKKFGERFGKPW